MLAVQDGNLGPIYVRLVLASIGMGFSFIKESPRWLSSKRKREAALRNPCWARQLQAEGLLHRRRGRPR